MRTRRLATAATLLLLLPLASGAGAGPMGTLTVSGIEATDGVLEGLLAGAVWLTPASGNATGQAQDLRDHAGQVMDEALATNTSYVQGWAGGLTQALTRMPSTDPPGDVNAPPLKVEAASAHVQIWRSTQQAYLEPTVEQVADDLWTGFRIDATARGDEESARLLVLPLDEGVPVARAGGASLLVTAADSTKLPALKSRADHPFTVDLANTIKAEPLGGGQVRVTGSFRIVVNALDLPYESNDGPGAVNTRRQLGPGAQMVSYGGTSVATNSSTYEAFIDVRDATLVMDGGDLYVHQPSLVAPVLDLQQAAGDLAGYGVGAQAHAEGSLDAFLESEPTATAPALRASLDGWLSRLVVDGQEREIPAAFAARAAAATPAGPSVAPSAGLAIALLAIPALPAAQWAASRRRFTKMDRALDRGDFETALRLAGRFTPWPGQRQDGVLAAAICLIGLGRSAEACDRLEGSRRWSASRRPMRDFLRARGHAALGRTEEATEALAASLLAEPALIAQARTDPVLAGLLDGPKDPTTQEAYA